MRNKFFTPEEDQFIRENLHLLDSEIGKALDRSAGAIKNYRTRKGIKKPEGTNQYLFKKGKIPWNKGISYMPKGGEATRFQKGHKLTKTAKVNDIAIRGKKEYGLYKFIKTESGKWKPLHRFLWEQLNGQLLPGKILRCKTEDTLNAEPDNWIAITRAENRRMNYNGEKSAESLKRIWKTVKIMESIGRAHRYKFRSKYANATKAQTNTKVLTPINPQHIAF